MSNAADTFNRIGDAKPMGDYANRLPLGRHRVALKNFNLKETEKKKDRLLEIEFMIVESTDPEIEAGETRSWMYFLSGEWAEYAERRAKAFIDTIAKCIGDTETPSGVLGMQLNDEAQPGRGIVLDVEVWVARNKDGSAKTAKKSGDEIHNASFKEVEQTGEDVAAMREQVENTVEPAPKTAKAAASKTAPVESAKTEPVKEPVKTGGGLGILRGLKK